MTTTRLLVVIGLATAPLAAQHRPAPTGRMMGDPMEMQEMMAPIAQVMLYTPQHLLPRKEALGLTADQVARLTALRDATTAAQDAAMSEAETHLGELQLAADAASPDSGVVKTHFQAAHAAAFPHKGRNALDAAVLGYMNVAALRQHIKPNERIRCGESCGRRWSWYDRRAFGSRRACPRDRAHDQARGDALHRDLRPRPG